MPEGYKVDVVEGKVNVKFDDGYTLEGLDPIAATEQLAKARFETRKDRDTWKAKAEAVPPTPPPSTPPPPTNPEEAQLQTYLMNQVATGLGLKDGNELKSQLTSMSNVTQKLREQAMAAEFIQLAPDFPNTKEAIDALGKKIEDQGWEFSVPNMLAAHTLCARESVYKPLSAEEQNAQWSAGLRASNKVPPPPPPAGHAPDNTGTVDNPYAVKLDKLRADILAGQTGQ